MMNNVLINRYIDADLFSGSSHFTGNRRRRTSLQSGGTELALLLLHLSHSNVEKIAGYQEYYD